MVLNYRSVFIDLNSFHWKFRFDDWWLDGNFRFDDWWLDGNFRFDDWWLDGNSRFFNNFLYLIRCIAVALVEAVSLIHE